MKNRLLIPALVLTLAGSVVATTAAAGATTTAKSHPAARLGAAEHVAAKPAAGVRPSITVAGGATAASPKLAANLQALASRPTTATAKSAGVALAKNGTVAVTVNGSDVAAAAKAVGAELNSKYHDQADLRIKPSALAALAAQPGISRVTKTNWALTQAAGEEVAASGASAWQAAAPALGNGGAGVNIAIVDAGFAQLTTEQQTGGGLAGANIVYNRQPPVNASIPDTDPANMDHCLGTSDAYNVDGDLDSDHGTAVAEIVHQMAPNATIYLYCISSSTQFNQAAAQIVANSNTVSGKIKIASSSLGFLGEGRGDGFGGADTTEGAVQAARRAGVLWIQSSGNYAQDHWSGALNNPRSSDGYLDLDLGDNQNIADAVELAPGTGGDVVLSWDQWPNAGARVSLQILGWNSTQNPNTDPPSESYADYDYNPNSLRLTPGSAPVLSVHIDNTSTTTNDYHTYYVFVQVLDTTGAVRYDLYYTGDFSPNYLAFAYAGTANDHGAAGSLTTPATSPYVLAVGAAYVGHAGDPTPTPVPAGSVEPFSSRGPTIDGRVKPDLIAFDGITMTSNFNDVESSQYDAGGNEVASTHGFYGTSASAPNVAGAAALVAAANPNLDASQLEAFLESPTASSSSTTSAALNPPTNALGHGKLQLGPADQSRVVPAAGTTYHGLAAPVRIAYTVSGLGVPKGTMTAGTELTVPVPTSVPSTATSVVVSLSGVNAQAGTYLSLYPNTWPGNSTLNLGSTDRNATVTAIVGLNAGHAFKLRNAAGKTDALVNLLGYFDTPANGGDGYASVAQTRVLDTRSGIGAPRRQLAPNARVTVDVSKAGVPANADVALINMTAINQNGAGYLTAFPDVGFAIGTVDYGAYQRSNMALVPIVNGKFTIQNRFATADAIVDVSGYFSSTATAQYVSLPAPVRVLNTATGTGGRLGAMSAVSTVSVDGGGLNQIPYNATALWAGLTAVATADGYISVYPNGGAVPHTSDVGYTKGRAVPNGSIPNLSAGTATTLPGFSTVVRAGSIQLYEDLYGYFSSPPAD